MSRPATTVAALATPVGTAAIALVRVSGPDTEHLARGILGRTPPPRVARHADYRDRHGLLLDDVVVTYFAGPRSYTGEDSLEVSCHGNPFIAQKILEDLFARGCLPAEPGEFTQRAFLNGRMDLSQAEAVMDLIHARSERALTAAHQQLRGSLGRRMTALMDRLLGLLAQIEAYIDFPDEDLPPEDRASLLREIKELGAQTDQLIATSHYGTVLRDGLKAVIVGAPNVGKSSLLNRLVGRERALVSSEPGTTRDYIEERIILGSHCLRLIDTAGLNPNPAELEKLGIDKTYERIGEADLLLIVLESGENPETALPHLPTNNARDKSLIIFNKSDLHDVYAGDLAANTLKSVSVSALTGRGIEQLCAALIALADTFCTEVGEDGVAINARHSSALVNAREALRRAEVHACTQGPAELLASDLRVVLSAYGEIIGRVDNERMLDQLFARFCIGK